ncbi:uncharacterized protein il12b2 [Engraulis encrasicolus]|uniref:uncharacterized protein il12b2 n=1 Tax=Engraulis encrasicolus TaxID=184585 RepID=UPI002FD609AC
MGVLAAGSLTVSAASFPKHMLVGRAGDSVTVECPGVSSDVIWMIGDVEMSETSPKWQIPELDEDWTGEYSCLHGSQQATVHVVLEDTADSRVHPLECWAENYVNCSFMCDWSDPNYPLARARNERTNGHPWVLVSPDGLFHVSHNTSAHHEEDAPINVTVEALTANKDRLVKTSKTFFLRDIIRPPAPQVTVCRNKTDAALDVDIRPAGSWPLPSYFPLEYEIEYLKKDNGESTSADIGPGVRGKAVLKTMETFGRAVLRSLAEPMFRGPKY